MTSQPETCKHELNWVLWFPTCSFVQLLIKKLPMWQTQYWVQGEQEVTVVNKASVVLAFLKLTLIQVVSSVCICVYYIIHKHYILITGMHAQLCLTLYNPKDCCPPDSSIHGISRQEYQSGFPFTSPRNLPNPGIKPMSPEVQADFLPLEPPGKPTHLLLFLFFLISVCLS